MKQLPFLFALLGLCACLSCNRQQTASTQQVYGNQAATNTATPAMQVQTQNNTSNNTATVPSTTIADSKPIAPTILSDTASCVQVAILLDTSNSMDGLIDQAKSQLWKIVNEIALARDSKGNIPQMLLALYDYGNDRYAAGDGYIKQIAPLTNDLDVISERLFALTTNGGSEYCGHVIKSATEELTWSKSADNVKIIFIAGNEEFTQGEVNYQESCRNAIAKGIVINTIFCGNHEEGINTKWKDGADLADGKYLNIDQDQKIVHIDAPQDTELNRLSKEINDTYIGYGAEGEMRKEMQFQQDSNAGVYGTANASQRAISKASKAYKNDSWDIVDAVKEKKLDIKTIHADELPAEMKTMKPEEREKYITEKTAKRAEIQTRIEQLNQERRKFVTEKEREMQQNNPNANTLDAVMLKAIRDQLIAKGMVFKN